MHFILLATNLEAKMNSLSEIYFTTERYLFPEILAKKGLADRIEFEYIEASEYWRWIAKKQFPDTETVRALFAKLKKFGKLDSPIELNDDMKKDFLET